MSNVKMSSLALRIFMMIAGLCIAIGFLAPIVFIGDPGSGSDPIARRFTIFACLLLSWTAGSSAIAIVLHHFIRRNATAFGYMAAGIVLVTASISIYYVSFYLVRDTTALLSFPLTLAFAYLGGGMLLAALIARRNNAATRKRYHNGNARPEL